jgi:hypothetical protein
MQNKAEPMMIRFVMAIMATALLGCGPAFAQVGGMTIPPGPSPLGMTSPLGIGPGSAVPPTGLRLGATEVPALGVSPMPSSTSPLTTCSGIGGSIPQASYGAASSSMGTTSGMGTSSAGISGSTSTFDGGSIAGTASGTCAAAAGSSLGGPAASASSPTGMGSASSVGRVGIPLGSTKLGVGGLSPPPTILTPNFSAPQSTLGTTMSPCPTTGMSATSGMSSGSC